jgi:hypothetical protein
MKVSVWLGAVAAAAACVTLTGCPNPNNIGVQTYGTVLATCVQASNNQPVQGAEVTISGQTPNALTNAAGQLTVPMVPIGTDVTAYCRAPGLSGSAVIPQVYANPQQTTVTIPMTPD